MTQYISFLQLKGGAGKSTLSANLCGFLLEKKKTVLAVDADLPQGTLSAWCSMFEHPKLTCETARNLDELMQVLEAAEGKYDYVVIDSPPRMAEIMNAILYISDLVLLPMAATSPDLWAVSDMAELITKALEAKDKKVNLRIVWNRFKNTSKSNEIREAALETFGYPEIPVPISNYVAYEEVIGLGKHALIHNHQKAKQQFQDFGKEVLKALKQG